MIKVKKVITKAIEDQFFSIDLSHLLNDDTLLEDIIEELDIESIADSIVEKLEPKVLTYQPTPDISKPNSPYSCSKCNRPFGQWNTLMGVPIQESLINTNGKRIIVIDDI